MFKDKVVLITGGSAGIGAATAELFAKEGAAVAIAGRNEVKLKEIAERCMTHRAQVLIIKGDINKDEVADTIVKQTIDKFGKVDVLVNNAGILKGAGILADNFLEVFDTLMNINMRAPVRITCHAVPYLIETKGNIVNLSSAAATETSKPNFIGYRTSKAAMNHFTRCCAFELAEYGVRVNSVSPGPVRTNIFDGVGAKAEDVKTHTAMNRVSETEEIADLIVYLASDKAKSITGSDYVIDNGLKLT